MKQEAQNPKSGAFKSGVTNISAAISSLFIAVIIAKSFGVQGLGTYFFLLIIGQALSRFFSGIGKSIRKSARSSEENASEYETVSVVLSIALWVIVFVVGVILVQFSESIYWVSLMEAYGVLVVFGGLSSYYLLHGAYTSRRDSSFIKVLRRILLAAVSALIVLYTSYGIGVLLISYGVVSALISAIMIPFIIPKKPSYHHVFEVLKSSGIPIIGSFASNFHHKTDVIIIGVIIGINRVGLYESALQLVIPMMLAASVSSELLSFHLQDSNSKYQATELVRSSVSYSTVLGFAALAVFLPLSVETLESFYTPEFKAAGLFLSALLITQFISAIRVPYEMALKKLGEQRKVLTVRTLSMFINIGISIYLVFKFGILGVIIATGVAELLTLLSYYIFVRRIIPQTIRIGEISLQIFSGLIVMIPLLILQKLNPIDQPQYYAVAVITGLTLYILLYIALSDRTRRTIYYEIFQNS